MGYDERDRSTMRLAVTLLVLGFSFSSLSFLGGRPGRVCPDGFAGDGPREARVMAMLQHTVHGRSSAGKTPEDVLMCFGAIDLSLVTDDGVMLLRDETSDAALAARVAHLLTHVHVGPARFDPERRPPTQDCDAWVDEVLRVEATAYATEIEVAHELGVTTPYEFDHGGPPREEPIATYLRDHPDGSRGVDALARGYMDRCARAARR